MRKYTRMNADNIESRPFNDYHVDPEIGRSDSTGRYSLNFVRYSALLAPITWVITFHARFAGAAPLRWETPY
jgi:hypothetical protein